GGFGRSHAIGVFDAQQKLAAVQPRETQIEQRDICGTDVRIARGRRCNTGADGHGLPRECEKRRTPNSAAIEKGGDYTSTPPNTHAIAILINRNGYNTVICAASIRADPAVRLNHYR